MLTQYNSSTLYAERQPRRLAALHVGCRPVPSSRGGVPSIIACCSLHSPWRFSWCSGISDPLTRTSLSSWRASQEPRSDVPLGAAEYRLPAGRVNTPFPLVCPAQRCSHLAGSLRRVPPLPHLPRTSYPSSSDPYVVSYVSLTRSMTSRDPAHGHTQSAFVKVDHAVS